MRKRTPAISFAIDGEGAADARASGSASTSAGAARGLRALGARRAVDHDVAVRVDLGARGRAGSTVVVSYCSTIAGPVDPVARAQQLAVVERRRVALGAPSTSNTTSRSSVSRATGSPLPRSSSAPVELVDSADADDADVHDLDRGVEAVAVLGLVRGVEALRELLDPGVVDGAGGHLGAHLVALARVAAVGEAPHEAPVVGERRRRRAARPPARRARRSRPSSGRWSRSRAACRSVATNSCWRSVASRPVAASDARVRRDEHARDLELERDVAREQRAGAADGDEREVARVVAAPHASSARSPGSSRTSARWSAPSAASSTRHPELPRDRSRSPAPRASRSSVIAAAEQAPVGPEPAEHELGVGRGRLGAAAAVAGRAGIGARGLRADAEARRPGRRRRSSRRRRRSCRCRPSAPSPGSRRPSCRAGGACAARRPPRRRCRRTCRRCRA